MTAFIRWIWIPQVNSDNVVIAWGKLIYPLWKMMFSVIFFTGDLYCFARGRQDVMCYDEYQGYGSGMGNGSSYPMGSGYGMGSGYPMGSGYGMGSGYPMGSGYGMGSGSPMGST